MNTFEKISEELVKYSVWIVLGLLTLLAAIIWKAIPKTTWMTIDSKIPKTVVWASLGIVSILLLVLIAYIIRLKKHSLKTLKSDNAELIKQLAELETTKNLLSSETQNSEPPSIKEAQLPILLLFLNNDPVWLETVVRSLKISGQEVEYHLGVLLEADFIEIVPRRRPDAYRLTHKGREYLYKSGYL